MIFKVANCCIFNQWTEHCEKANKEVHVDWLQMRYLRKLLVLIGHQSGHREHSGHSKCHSCMMVLVQVEWNPRNDHNQKRWHINLRYKVANRSGQVEVTLELRIVSYKYKQLNFALSTLTFYRRTRLGEIYSFDILQDEKPESGFQDWLPLRSWNPNGIPVLNPCIHLCWSQSSKFKGHSKENLQLASSSEHFCWSIGNKAKFIGHCAFSLTLQI